MDFIQSLNYLLNTSELSYFVVHFNAQVLPYPLFFFLYQQLKLKYSITVYNIAEIGLDEFKLLIQTEFLGQSLLLWITHVEDLPTPKQEYFSEIVANYQGPHKIFFYNNVELSKKDSKWLSVSISPVVDIRLFNELASVILKEKKVKYNDFFINISRYYQQFSWSDAYYLITYARLLGKPDLQFTSHWLPKLVSSSHSLFLLSQYFFSYKQKQFFALWHTIAMQYSEQFWIFYWSDQLMRAATYCHYMEKNNSNAAKKNTYRLPFSFLQKDWQKNNSSLLANAHSRLYEVDYRSKNGNDGWLGLELFYFHFFKIAVKDNKKLNE